MKYTLFTLAVIFSLPLFAATGTGHAQAELTSPLTVTNSQDVNFGIVAVDPAAGAQDIVMINSTGYVFCPPEYVCSGSTNIGEIDLTFAPNTTIYISTAGQTATLSDGIGNTLVYDPIMFNGASQTDSFSTSDPSGTYTIEIWGRMYFTGSEPAGAYSTQNAGGTGFQVTVNY